MSGTPVILFLGRPWTMKSAEVPRSGPPLFTFVSGKEKITLTQASLDSLRALGAILG